MGPRVLINGIWYYAIIRDDPPMTVRQTFYQLVARGVIEKTEEEYQGTVIRLMTEMRLEGRLPFAWVVDETRRVRVTQTFDSIADALEHTAKFYRRSALAQSPDYVEIWCEKDALAGVLWDVTSDYDVPLMVSRGMPSLTFLHGSAQEIYRAAEQGKRAHIYQFGDHDPSGVLIPQTIERRLNEMCQRLDCPAPIVERVALTEELDGRRRPLGGGGLCSPAPPAGRRQNLNLPSRQFNLRIKRIWGNTQPTAVDFQDVTQKGLADILEIPILIALSYFVAGK